MTGNIIGVLNAGSFWLLIVAADGAIVEQPIEPRYMRDLIEGEGLESPHDLEGREVEMTDDGMSIGLT